MNSFESASTETEQQEVEQINTRTVSQEPETVPAPVSIPVSVPEIVPVSISVSLPDPETELEEEGEEEDNVVDEAISDSAEPNETFEMETLPQISSELAFSCLLIPRFSDHYLTGDIAKDLVIWMKEICISYGWRLNAVTVRPGYLQWVITVPLTENPAQLIRITRQQTSKKILEDYPRFKRKNLSLDFWAPGFSIVHGNALQSMESINNFIIEVRKQQGIS